MKKYTMLFCGLLVMAMTQPVLANDDTGDMPGMHMHGAMHGDMKNPCSMDAMQGDMAGHHSGDQAGMMKGAFMVKKEIDGYTVSFHIMKAPKGMEHGGTHHVMIKVEQDGKVITDLVANSKATHPNGASESKMMMKMGDWYMAAYDLGHPGKHQLMLLFKTADGAKHFGGIHYPKDK